MLAVVREDNGDGLANFNAVANFIGTRNAELRSHIEVSNEFLNRLWNDRGQFDLPCMQATGGLLERLIRFRSEDWALVLAFLRRRSSPPVQCYIDGWIRGHFLRWGEFAAAMSEIDVAATRLRTEPTRRSKVRSIPASGKRPSHKPRRR